LDQVKAPDVIPREILDTINEVRLWVRDLTDDWNVVKREIIFELPFSHRVHFTTRDPITKDNIALNKMEEQLTGVKLIVRSLEERRKLGIRLR